jgi:hypothetical protein
MMDDGRWMMDDGRWMMDDGRWMIDDGRWTMDDGRWRRDAHFSCCITDLVKWTLPVFQQGGFGHGFCIRELINLDS